MLMLLLLLDFQFVYVPTHLQILKYMLCDLPFASVTWCPRRRRETILRRVAFGDPLLRRACRINDLVPCRRRETSSPSLLLATRCCVCVLAAVNVFTPAVWLATQLMPA